MSGVAKLRSEYNNSLHFLQLPHAFPHSIIEIYLLKNEKYAQHEYLRYFT